MLKFFSSEYESSIIEFAKLRMVKRLSMLFAAVFGALTIAFWNSDFFAWIAYFIAFIISATVLVYLYTVQKHRFVFIFYALSGSILANLACHFSLTTPHYVDFLWMILCSFIGFIGYGKRFGLFVLSLNGIGMGLFVFFSLNTHIEVLQPFTFEEQVGAYAEILLAVIIISTILYEFIRFQEIALTNVREVNAELSEKNTLIEEKNNENITLLKEVHHRVKNNLQIIVSLLRLQVSEKNEPHVERYFEEAINRIMSMALIHEKLYQQDDIAQIKIEGYTLDLCTELNRIYGQDLRIDYKVDSELKGLNLKTIVPVGLIINELVSNSLKHGYNNSIEGKIKIHFKNKNTKEFELSYTDDGIGIQDNLKKGFGSELIELLTEQLNGERKLLTTPKGVSYSFKLYHL
ncbi:MAG: sensor histidine kinase [Crocinitomicaceae bacterium]|nr:sensor histidine kinase [Crocinitomicaceae bacterium]